MIFVFIVSDLFLTESYEFIFELHFISLVTTCIINGLGCKSFQYIYNGQIIPQKQKKSITS